MKINEWFGLVEIVIILVIVLVWVGIGIQKIINIFQGKCPKDRICENSKCRIGAWCEKYQRFENAYKNAFENMRELRKEEKRKKQKKNDP